MYILNDESIQSVIYRAHLLNGISDFRNVVDPKGRWLAFPRIKAGTIDIYRQLGDKQILSILKRQSLVKFSEHRFGLPALYKSDLQYFFCLTNQNIKMYKQKIMFCIKCIREEIYDYGFCSFKIDWINHSHCKKHEIPLFVIPQKSRKDTLHCLRMIFRGEVPDGSTEVSNERHDFYYGTPQSRIKKRLYFSQCLKEAFAVFISEERFDFELDISDRLRDLLRKGQPAHFYMSQLHIVKQVFDALKNSKSIQLKNFLDKHTEIKVVNTGVFRQTSITETFLKSNRENCSACKKIECFLHLNDLLSSGESAY